MTASFGIIHIARPTENFINKNGEQCDDWVIYCTLGNFSKPVATLILPKLPTFLVDFCKVIKTFNFAS